MVRHLLGGIINNKMKYLYYVNYRYMKMLKDEILIPLLVIVYFLIFIIIPYIVNNYPLKTGGKSKKIKM